MHIIFFPLTIISLTPFGKSNLTSDIPTYVIHGSAYGVILSLVERRFMTVALNNSFFCMNVDL